MQNKLMQAVEAFHLRTDIPAFQVGDTVIVHQRLLDGQKERTQPFEGDVIARGGAGVRETFTVRRIVQGEGVERIFPVHAPRIARIEIKKAGMVRRAKLYYIRERVGKAVKIKGDPQRQAQIDAAAKASAEAAAKDKEASPTGESKRAAKRKAKAEAAAKK